MARPTPPSEPLDLSLPVHAASGPAQPDDVGPSRFWSDERRAGALLVAATAVAVLWASSPWPGSYSTAWTTPLHLSLIGSWLPDGRAWVDNGAMTAFFLVIGLEIGQEHATGVLARWRPALIPVVAAAGGMVGAAALYSAVVHGGVGSAGWGVPMATDIAFVAGAAGLLGRRVPGGLRVFLVTLAVADDVGSVVVLAVVSGHQLSPVPLVAAVVVAGALVGGRRRWTRPWPYLLGLVVLWVAMASAGVEPALAGAVVGVLVPAETRSALYGRLSPWSGTLVLPLFALANAGVDLRRPLLAASGAAVVFVAVVAARMVGKLVGVTTAAVGASAATGGGPPAGTEVGPAGLVGGAALTGMGFTVPLLFAAVVFADRPALFAAAQIGLLVGTAGAGVAGTVTLAWLGRSRR